MGLLILFLLTSSQFPVGWFEYEIIDWIAMKRYLIFLFSLFLMGKAISQEVVRWVTGSLFLRLFLMRTRYGA